MLSVRISNGLGFVPSLETRDVMQAFRVVEREPLTGYVFIDGVPDVRLTAVFQRKRYEEFGRFVPEGDHEQLVEHSPERVVICDWFRAPGGSIYVVREFYYSDGFSIRRVVDLGNVETIRDICSFPTVG
jgi:hypothetical protein